MVRTNLRQRTRDKYYFILRGSFLAFILETNNLLGDYHTFFLNNQRRIDLNEKYKKYLLTSFRDLADMYANQGGVALILKKMEEGFKSINTSLNILKDSKTRDGGIFCRNIFNYYC